MATDLRDMEEMATTKLGEALKAAATPTLDEALSADNVIGKVKRGIFYPETAKSSPSASKTRPTSCATRCWTRPRSPGCWRRRRRTGRREVAWGESPTLVGITITDYAIAAITMTFCLNTYLWNPGMFYPG